MRLRLLVFAIVLSLTLLGVAQSASAQVAGEEQGVTVVRGSQGHVIRFAKRAAKVYRRIAGRRVIVGCSTVTKLGGSFVVEGGASSVIRAPRTRRSIRTHDVSKSDFCFVRLRRGRELVATAPITANGRTYIDERLWVVLMDLPFSLTDEGTDVPPSTALVVERGRGLIVALDGPEGTPPPGKLGYWTDGVRSVCAALSAAGRRLFLDIEHDVVRTNVLPYLTAGD
jgi:hypothetical protein